MGLLNYPIIIKKPMDLQSIKQSIQNDKYKTYDVVFSDIQLIWSNCKQYNQQGSPIYTQAEKMERKSKKLIKELKAKIFNTSKSKVNKSKGKPVSKMEDVKIPSPTHRSIRRGGLWPPPQGGAGDLRSPRFPS